MILRKCSQPHKRRYYRNIIGFSKFTQLGTAPGRDYSTTYVYARALRDFDHRFDPVYIRSRRLRRQKITRQIHLRIQVHHRNLLLYILGNVDQHRTGTAGFRQVERFTQNPRNVRRIKYKITVLDHRTRHPYNVRLLKYILTYHVRRYLAGYEYHRNRIHITIRNSG